MKWPDPSDYQDAVQNPSLCFIDGDLRAGRTAVTALGIPRVASGNYASVYEVGCGPKKWAVRCFLRQVQDHRRRYALVSQHLHKWATPNLVGFEYLPSGIRLFGQTYPIIKMDWVEGQTLVTYVENCLPDGATLLQLASQWRSLVRHLQRNQIAHGDLQHGNVLVMANGNLRLVDYDAMYVPALRGEKCLEIGHRNFQHPKRTPADFDERLDDFSATVIYASLRALAADPDLWMFHDDDDKLILAEEDYKSPSTSPVLARLVKSPDAGVCILAREIGKSSLSSACSAPRFSQIVEVLPEPPPPKKQFAGGAASPRLVASPLAPTAGPRPISPPPIPAQRRPQPFGAIPAPAPVAWPQPQPASPGRWKATFKQLLWVYLVLLVVGAVAHPSLLGALVTAGLLGCTILTFYKRSWRYALAAMGCVVALVVGARLASLLPSGNGIRSLSPAMPTLRQLTGEKNITNSLGMKLSFISPGKFVMGAPAREEEAFSEEQPQHAVRITKPFYIGVYEVTQREYQSVMGTNPSTFRRDSRGNLVRAVLGHTDTDSFPVENVGWNDAVEFCQRLSARPEEMAAHQVYRLPTEAEWEYACRAGTTTPFHFGSQLNGRQANSDGAAYGTPQKGPNLQRTTAVGSYAPNGFGLYDMHGNIAEWCADWDGPYTAEACVDPTGPETGSTHVFRGGSWKDWSGNCRAAARNHARADFREDFVGFRVVLTEGTFDPAIVVRVNESPTSANGPRPQPPKVPRPRALPPQAPRPTSPPPQPNR